MNECEVKVVPEASSCKGKHPQMLKPPWLAECYIAKVELWYSGERGENRTTHNVTLREI